MRGSSSRTPVQRKKKKKVSYTPGSKASAAWSGSEESGSDDGRGVNKSRPLKVKKSPISARSSSKKRLRKRSPTPEVTSDEDEDEDEDEMSDGAPLLGLRERLASSRREKIAQKRSTSKSRLKRHQVKEISSESSDSDEREGSVRMERERELIKIAKEQEIDPITCNNLDFDSMIAVTSPDGLTTVFYNASTLKTIAEKANYRWLQPPHFRA